MSKVRKLSDSIEIMCNGAEDEDEFNNGVNILIQKLNIKDDEACKIRSRLFVKDSIISVPVNMQDLFLETLTGKPVQYSRLTDKQVKKLVKNVAGAVDMEKFVIDILKEMLNMGRSKGVAFNKYDKSHFLSVCLEKIGVSMSEALSSAILDIE